MKASQEVGGFVLPKVVVYLVRHGEKPGETFLDDPFDGPNLNHRGHSRAYALSVSEDALPEKADYIFATKRSKNSVRPIETIKPYAKSRGVKINHDYADADYHKLAKAILKISAKAKAATTNIVVAWHHGTIPKLLVQLNACITGVAPMTAGKWAEDIFDRIIVLEYSRAAEDSTVPSIVSRPQSLLFGDSSS